MSKMYVHHKLSVKDGEDIECRVYVDNDNMVSISFEKTVASLSEVIYVDYNIRLPLELWRSINTKVQEGLNENGHEA